jgi:hypothetical protein
VNTSMAFAYAVISSLSANICWASRVLAMPRVFVSQHRRQCVAWHGDPLGVVRVGHQRFADGMHSL